MKLKGILLKEADVPNVNGIIYSKKPYRVSKSK
jgi:hypothetical protein